MAAVGLKTRQERLLGTAAVKGGMLQAHLGWAQKRLGDMQRVAVQLPPDCVPWLTNQMLVSSWVPFRCLILVDRAIAAAVGGMADYTFRDLGRHSATENLGGVYKAFISSEPHRVFAQMGLLHSRFQNFGRFEYQQRGASAGRITMRDYSEYSPVYCTSAVGYFEAALKMMHAPGRILVREVACQCAGDPQCLFDLSW